LEDLILPEEQRFLNGEISFVVRQWKSKEREIRIKLV
jgi:hypothetical protein